MNWPPLECTLGIKQKGEKTAVVKNKNFVCFFSFLHTTSMNSSIIDPKTTSSAWVGDRIFDIRSATAQLNLPEFHSRRCRRRSVGNFASRRFSRPCSRMPRCTRIVHRQVLGMRLKSWQRLRYVIWYQADFLLSPLYCSRIKEKKRNIRITRETISRPNAQTLITLLPFILRRQKQDNGWGNVPAEEIRPWLRNGVHLKSWNCWSAFAAHHVVLMWKPLSTKSRVCFGCLELLSVEASVRCPLEFPLQSKRKRNKTKND